MIEILEQGDKDETSDRDLAMRVSHALCRLYPDHPWLVSFQGRCLVVRHMAISDAVRKRLGRDGFGAVLPPDEMRTHKQTVQMAMRFGGLLLEAFNLPRGKWDGRPPEVTDKLNGLIRGFR